jgi:hypothetical protein
MENMILWLFSQNAYFMIICDNLCKKNSWFRSEFFQIKFIMLFFSSAELRMMIHGYWVVSKS